MAEPDLNKLLANAPKPAKKPVPMTGNGMGKGMTNKGMKSGTSMNNGMGDEDYLGYGFDAAVRKGVGAARDALKQRISNLDAGKQQALMARFETEIASQKSLQKDRGLGEGYKEVYREAAAMGGSPTREEADRLVNARRGLSNVGSTVKSVGRTVKSVGNAINKTIVGPKPSRMGTDRYYGEGGI